MQPPSPTLLTFYVSGVETLICGRLCMDCIDAIQMPLTQELLGKLAANHLAGDHLCSIPNGAAGLKALPSLLRAVHNLALLLTLDHGVLIRDARCQKSKH